MFYEGSPLTKVAAVTSLSINTCISFVNLNTFITHTLCIFHRKSITIPFVVYGISKRKKKHYKLKIEMLLVEYTYHNRPLVKL